MKVRMKKAKLLDLIEKSIRANEKRDVWITKEEMMCRKWQKLLSWEGTNQLINGEVELDEDELMVLYKAIRGNKHDNKDLTE